MPQTMKVALYSVDPPGLTTFRAFDPESFSLISLINDALIYIDTEGAVQPALALSWRRVSPLELELQLRRDVRFHNGEPFDADAVVATFRAHREPSPSASARGILGVIAGATRVDDFCVRVQTSFPDAMLLRRLFLSSIYPRAVLEQQGRDALAAHPIGTGPYRFESYEPGKELVLTRNPAHWAGRAQVDVLRFPILRQKEWVDRLARGELDAALGIDSHDRMRASRLPELSVASRRAAISQWCLLANRGPLADVRVRRALNHAIHRRLLADVTEHGFGAPQRSIATEGQQGYTDCEPYRYSPELARSLLEQAGHGQGFALRGLVSETSTAVYFAVREFLLRIGVSLEAEIVPRGQWLQRIVGGHMQGTPYDGDFAISMFDNPILHTLFHHFIFLYSHGPFSLLHDADYDREFLKTATTFEESEAREAQARLERHARDNALVLFTVQADVHAAFRAGFSCELPSSGHFQMAALTSLRASPGAAPARNLPASEPGDSDASVLLEGTSHAGVFFLRPDAAFERAINRRIWDNIQTTESRWRLQNEPLLRELVAQVEARTNLANVLGSTERVAIVGYSEQGRRLFVNRGYAALLGDSGCSVFEHLGAQWPIIRARVDAARAWLGPVHLTGADRPAGAPDHLYLSVTHAVDEEGMAMGYTFVFSDFSGEEERIRHAAIRSILDNVPYGLFMCDRQCRVLAGYSAACTRFFVGADAGIQGRSLPDLLGMDERTGGHFTVCYEQVIEDFFPEDVSLGNLPERIEVGSHTYALSGSVVRADDQSVSAVLFTLLDITPLIAAEREIEALRGALQVLRYRESFAGYVARLHAQLEGLARDPAPSQHAMRLLLHTAKGELGQFQLHGLARQIHELENKEQLAVSDLHAISDGLRHLLEHNQPLWGIRLGQSDEHITTTVSALTRLEARVGQATSLEEARRVLAQELAGMRQHLVSELVGPLAESCQQHAERLSKQVRFELAGAELRWPAQLAPVFEVLPHLIRNSVDHGIEPPEERGDKAPVATIRMSIGANDNGLHITVRDDGRGIATERVVRRAIELGALSAEQAAALSPAQQAQLIFVEGLSTADQLTRTAGRGVGMAAVKETVEALGGRLTVDSELGRGTEFRIDFPRAG